MERLMPGTSESMSEDQLAQNLRQTNTCLRLWLESLETADAQRTPPNPRIVPELLSELLRAGEWLRDGVPAACGPELEAEVGEYRRNLGRLRSQMPAIHNHLLQERVRLEAERARLESVAAWAAGSHQSL
jgi:hypothetical protein